MNKIIKITDDEIVIGKDDGSVLKTAKSNANYDAKVDDVVDVFVDGDTTIIAKSKKYVEKKECKFLTKLIRGCQRLLPIIFSSIFALSLICLIVVCAVPRGKMYKNKQVFGNIIVNSEISFSGKNMTVRNYYNGNDSKTVFEYKIKNGKLFYFSKTANKYLEFGSLSSTKIEVEDSENQTLIFVEKGMKSLVAVFIVLTVVSGLCDIACFTVIILTMKGIIKLDDKKMKQNKVSSEK